MTTPILQEGKISSEYRITQVVVAAGIVIQVSEEFIAFKKNQDFVTSTAKDSQQSIVHLVQDLKGDSYIGGILAIVVTFAYIVKRTLLKYLAMKGQVQVELAKIQAELKSAQSQPKDS